MIKTFVDRFDAKRAELMASFGAAHPENYMALVQTVIQAITSEDVYRDPDPKRIHQIDDGDYQGTLVFVIGSKGYQPDDYWFVKVSYGSCSGCDTLQSISNYSSEPPTPEQVQEYLMLATHVIQGLKPMQEENS